MTPPTDQTPSRAGRLRVPLFVLFGCVALTVVAFVVADNTARTTAPATPPTPPTPPTPDAPVEPSGASASYAMPTFPGVRLPPAVPAAGAGLADGEEVVGVVANGKARAYRLRTMKEQAQGRLINDLLAGTPVTITYCHIKRSVRVFTADSTEVLDIGVSGFQPDGMILSVFGRQFRQDTGRPVDPRTPVPPLTSYPFEQTTWKLWREAHPDTDVSTGTASTAAK